MDLTSGLRFYREKVQSDDSFRERIIKGLDKHQDDTIEKLLKK